jgi:hypothetical protein
MSAFVIDMLGLSYVEPPPFDLRACYEVHALKYTTADVYHVLIHTGFVTLVCCDSFEIASNAYISLPGNSRVRYTVKIQYCYQ